MVRTLMPRPMVKKSPAWKSSNASLARMISIGTGKVGCVICDDNTCRMPPWCFRWPAMMVNENFGRNAGEKKGKPVMWSQWVWESKICADRRFLRMNQWPKLRRPVAASSTTRWPPNAISTQLVLPPNRT